MQVIVSESSMFERTLEVTVESKLVEQSYERAFGRALKRLRLPGFRPGKVPAAMGKRYIHDEGLGNDVVDEVLPLAYRAALQEKQLQPISEPKWELLQRGRGKDLIFKVSFEVRPLLEIANYSGVEVRSEKDVVDDQVVEAALEELRVARSQLVDLQEDRPLQLGDVALVDFRSLLDGEPIEGGGASNYLMELKEGQFLPGFLDHLLGMSAGEEKVFELVFPESFPVETMAGQAITFDFKVHQIKCRQVPEASDEFAKDCSPFQTIGELREHLRETKEAEAERKAREQVAIKIIDSLLSQVTNTMVPSALHQYRSQVEVRRRVSELMAAGISVERYLESRGLSQEQWVQEASIMGMLEARVEIILYSIATRENLFPSSEEIEEVLAVEAKRRHASLASVREALEKDGSLGVIHYSLLRAKVMDFLYDQAKVEFVPPGTLAEEAKLAAENVASEVASSEVAPGEGASNEASLESPKPDEAEEGEKKPKTKSRSKKSENEVEGEDKPKPKRVSKKKAEGETEA